MKLNALGTGLVLSSVLGVYATIRMGRLLPRAIYLNPTTQLAEVE